MMLSSSMANDSVEDVMYDVNPLHSTFVNSCSSFSLCSSIHSNNPDDTDPTPPSSPSMTISPIRSSKWISVVNTVTSSITQRITKRITNHISNYISNRVSTFLTWYDG